MTIKCMLQCIGCGWETQVYIQILTCAANKKVNNFFLCTTYLCIWESPSLSAYVRNEMTFYQISENLFAIRQMGDPESLPKCQRKKNQNHQGLTLLLVNQTRKNRCDRLRKNYSRMKNSIRAQKHRYSFLIWSSVILNEGNDFHIVSR